MAGQMFVTGLDVDEGGNLYAADFHNHRVQKIAHDGSFLTAFGEPGDGVGQFAYVSATAVAPNGAVFVADFANHRIQKWLPGG